MSNPVMEALDPLRLIDAKLGIVLGEIKHPETLGYYGPPPEGVWSHDRSVRFDTLAEAKSAHAARYGNAREEGNDGMLCHWKDGWGPLMVWDRADDWYGADMLMLALRKRGYGVRFGSDELGAWWAELHRRAGSAELFGAHGKTGPEAISRAALEAFEAHPEWEYVPDEHEITETVTP